MTGIEETPVGLEQAPAIKFADPALRDIHGKLLSHTGKRPGIDNLNGDQEAILEGIAKQIQDLDHQLSEGRITPDGVLVSLFLADFKVGNSLDGKTDARATVGTMPIAFGVAHNVDLPRRTVLRATARQQYLTQRASFLP